MRILFLSTKDNEIELEAIRRLYSEYIDEALSIYDQLSGKVSFKDFVAGYVNSKFSGWLDSWKYN